MALCKVGVLPGATLAAVLVSALSGCGSTPPPQVGLATPLYAPEMGHTPFENGPVGVATLGPADVISVTVFREPDLSAANTSIDPNGMINMPLIGSIQASGKTTSELAGLIEGKLSSGYLVRPRVSVSIISVGSRKITVEGAVDDPGLYDLPVGTKLSGAIALANGLDRVAKQKQIVVFREASDGMYIARFDYAAMQAGTMADPVLKPGDRVVVGTSGLSQAWQDFLRMAPLIAVFQRF